MNESFEDRCDKLLHKLLLMRKDWQTDLDYQHSLMTYRESTLSKQLEELKRKEREINEHIRTSRNEETD